VIVKKIREGGGEGGRRYTLAETGSLVYVAYVFSLVKLYDDFTH